MSGEILSATFVSVSKRDRTPLMFHVVIFNCFFSATLVYVSDDPLRVHYDASSFLVTMRYIMAHPNETMFRGGLLCIIRAKLIRLRGWNTLVKGEFGYSVGRGRLICTGVEWIIIYPSARVNYNHIN